MPWSNPMEQRRKLIAEIEGGQSVAEASRRAGISRKTAYKWLERYQPSNPETLADRSRAPHHCPHAVPEAIVERLLDVKAQHPTWGPRTVVDHLRDRETATHWPSPSTVGEIFDRFGLVKHERRRRRATPSEQPFAPTIGSNATWCMDFKGWWRARNGERCDPFTVTDAATRFLIRSQLVLKCDFEHVQPIIEAAFREYGLPRAIRTDNGPPFATPGHLGLSRLSIWWLKLGIPHERIQPGKPQQNGRHERMHRTLKAEVPIASTRRLQQQALDRFRFVFNEERPHRALGGKTPSSVYRASDAPFPSTKRCFHYPQGARLLKVRSNGCLKWKGRDLFVSETLTGEYLAIENHNDDLVQLFLGPLPYAFLDLRTNKMVFSPKQTPKKVSPMFPV